VAEIDCANLATREINSRLKAAIAGGEPEVVLLNPAARHNLAVGILQPGRVRIEGPVGYYGAGLCDGVDVEIAGSAGWGLAENLMSGRVVLRGSAGNGAAASIRGGEVIIHGHAAARAGIAMKGGTLLIGGNAGYMTGFMMQKGTMIICGDTDDALGDSMYEGRIFVGGAIRSLGNDAVEEDLTDEDRAFLQQSLSDAGLPSSVCRLRPTAFRKIVSGRQLYNFDKRHFDRWRHAL
jgi:glutamate synthase domain-containing protein 3